MPAVEKKILLLNGPNLNLLGTREPDLYGSTTLPQITTHLTHLALTKSIPISVSSFQSNHEGALIDAIHSARTDGVSAIIINPGAYTHTSIAIRDALLAVEIPFIEVHVTNVHGREEFRRHSYLSDRAVAVIAGLGVYGYVAALEYWVWAWDGRKERGFKECRENTDS